MTGIASFTAKLHGTKIFIVLINYNFTFYHLIVYGFGRFERDGISYSVKPGDIFVIPPNEKTYYEADQKKPWRYIWIGFTTNQSVPEQLLKPDHFGSDERDNGRLWKD